MTFGDGVIDAARTFAVGAVVLLAAPAAAQEYQSKELADAATAYRQELIDSIPAAKKQPALIPRLRRDADAEYRAKRYAQAIDDLSHAIAYGADDGLVWLRLAQAPSGARRTTTSRRAPTTPIANHPTRSSAASRCS